MKTKKINWFIAGVLLIVLGGCSPKKAEKIVVSTEAIPLQSETILFSKDSSSYFYDLKITEDYLLFLDNSSDTILQAYGNDNRMKLFSLKGRGDSALFKPQFTKSDLQKTKNGAQIIDNDLYSKILVLKEGKVLISSSFLSQNMINSFDYNITSREIYAVPTNGRSDYQFFSYNTTDDYYWVDGDSIIKQKIGNIPAAYLSHLCVKEQADVVVSAMRFTNSVQFYDLKGKLKQVIKFGENTILPIKTGDGKSLDILNTPKCFIGICGTSKYVYCLYNGTSDFSSPSNILVFNWSGDHISTLQCNRGLRNIAVDEDNSSLIALSSRTDGGTDVLKYKLEL